MVNKQRTKMAETATTMNDNNNNSETNDTNAQIKAENFMAEMVEVRVKMYACRICGIRYDNMDSIRQHYNEVHPTDHESDDGASSKNQMTNVEIKEEIMDDEDVLHHSDGTNSYVLVDDEGHLQLPKGLQVVQISDGGEDGQIVLQVINQDENEVISSEDIQTALVEHQDSGERPQQFVIERRRTRQQAASEALRQIATNDNATESAGAINEKQTSNKRGRKRKTPESQTKVTTITTPVTTSTRPRRVVVPNIKSEFIYEGLSQSVVTEQPKQTNSSSSSSSQQYTFIQEGGVITAFQVDASDVEAVNDDDGQNNKKQLISGEDLEAIDEQHIKGEIEEEEEDESYPAEYTPTSNTKKGRQVEPKSAEDDHLRRFPCPFQGCKYVAKYRSNLWDHKKTHTGEKPYACNWPSCTMRFSQTHQLKLHLRSHTGERPYVCDWPGCNSAFSQKPGLKSHMLTHTGEKPFKCDFPGCGWTFRLKGALTDHKRAIHENAKKHICEWPGCNKRFLQQCHLKKHIMGHADIKPFACDWPNCNYKAVTMAYVTNHRKTHTGEKNYECTYPNCNKKFVKSSHVNRHRQRCHPELFMVLQEDLDVSMTVEDEDGEQHTVVVSVDKDGQAIATIENSDEQVNENPEETTVTPQKSGRVVAYKLTQNGTENNDADGTNGQASNDEDGEQQIFQMQQEDAATEVPAKVAITGRMTTRSRAAASMTITNDVDYH